jgi:endonuclease/exonuclease/phosphatase family metal-dependent hydrolase
MQFVDHGSTDRMTCARFRNTSFGELVVVGTVLPWRSDSLFRGAKGFCKAIGDQARDWKQIASLHCDATLVVAGDFNQSLPYQHRYGTKDGAVALDRAIKEVGLYCTTEGTTDESTEHPRIDHICISRNRSKTDVFPKPKTWKMPVSGSRPVSDHGGAFVDLESSWFNAES